MEGKLETIVGQQNLPGKENNNQTNKYHAGGMVGGGRDDRYAPMGSNWRLRGGWGRVQYSRAGGISSWGVHFGDQNETGRIAHLDTT